MKVPGYRAALNDYRAYNTQCL